MRVRHRLLLVLLGAASIAGLLVALGATELIRSATRERIAQRVRADTSLIAEWMRDAPEANPQELAVRAAAGLHMRVTLITRDGVVIGDSARQAERLAEMDNHAARPEIEAARLGGVGESLRRSATNNVKYLYIARSVGDVESIGYVRIAVPVSALDQVGTRAPWLLLLLAGTVVVLTVPGYVAVRRLSRPIEALADVVGRSATVHLAEQLPVGGGPEVASLRDAVLRMQSSLLARIAELDAERALSESVISGMREGLLVVGADRRVRLANDGLRRLLDLDIDPHGLLLEEVFRNPTLVRDVGSALESGREVGGSVVRLPGSGRSFQLQITPLRGARGEDAAVLAWLFDISKLERLEAVRREFVANVSHELRTPLTAIAASVETLLDGAIDTPRDAQRFLDIIGKHTQRMGDLVEDLTDLSRIETGAISLDVQPLDLGEVARSVVDRLTPLADSRGIKIRLDVSIPLIISADHLRLEQILTNLIDNAIKFNRTDGEISIRARVLDGQTTLTVQDTGIGIPADSLDKVFHRFHQVSRDRSRELRGTGLGLAIVKHLMRLHGGSVAVESELGAGSRFSLRFAVFLEPEAEPRQERPR